MSKFIVEVVNRHNNESCSLRLTCYNRKNEITDIIEGPTRIVINEMLMRVSPETKLGLRKIRR